MKLIVTLLASLALTGCASNCTHACIMGFGPGSTLFNTVADSADRSDPCQTQTHSTLTGARLKPDLHIKPDYCRYRGTRTEFNIYDRTGGYQGRIQSK